MLLPIQDSSYAINSIYAGMFAEISSLTNNILANTDLTGLSFAQSTLRASLAENTENASSINEGISMIQATEYAVDTISDKVDRMKELATNAASGEYTQEEVDVMQTEFDQLATEINEIAINTTPDGNNILNKEGGTVSVSIGTGISISVDTTVMTTTGLGIIHNIDLTNDPEGAVTGLEAAATQIDTYQAHLESKGDSLATASQVVSSQSQSLLAVESMVNTIGSAMTMVGSLNTMAASMASLFLVAQSSFNIDSIMQIIAEDQAA